MSTVRDGQGAGSAATARHLWGRLEAIHTMHYFAPSVLGAHAALGFDHRMASYVASRSAPFGAVGPEVVTASFYGFSPRLIATVLPAAWEVASPAQVLEASLAALGSLLGELFSDLQDEVVRTAELLREAASLHPIIGRPLAAVWSGIDWHADANVRLWQGATIVRESRGGGHVACLLDAQLDGVEAHLIARGDGAKLRAVLGPIRGYADPEWDAAVTRLADRGLLTADGALTDAGAALRAHIESRTDILAAPPWERLGPAATEQLATSLEPLVERAVASGILPGVVVRVATA